MIRSDRLPCGVRFVTERMDEVRSVALGVWVGTGSRDEDDARSGASHFLEHLLFKGTSSWSAAAIAEAVDEVGGDMNAFTTKEYTAFYIRLLSEHLPLGLDVLGSIMTDPALRPSDVDAERQVILDEILMHADEPSDLALEQSSAAIFAGHPLGRDVLGTAGSVESLSADDIRRFFDAHYRPGNLVVAAAGDLDHDLLAEQVERWFSCRSGGEPPTRQAPTASEPSVVLTRRPTEQANLVLALAVPGRHDGRRWPLAMLDHSLGGGMSSRLFQEIRERRGLAYAVWSERALYHDVGLLTIGVGTAPAHARQVLDLVHGALDELAAHGISDRELAVAKGYLRAQTLLSLEDSGARMSRVGAGLLLHDHVLEVDELLEQVDAVTVDDVAGAARLVGQSPRTLSVVGPFEPDDFGAFRSSPVAAG